MNQIKVISSYLNQNEIHLTGEAELRETLRDFLKYGNNVVLLEFPGYGRLTIGIGTPYGFVEYMDNDGSPPYLVAKVDMENQGKDTLVEFDSGGTPTPIPMENCLPFDRVVDIVEYFLRNKILPEDANWIEV
jgi:hypothetical protein